MARAAILIFKRSLKAASQQQQCGKNSGEEYEGFQHNCVVLLRKVRSLED